MTVLVTGASGFLGRHLIKELYQHERVFGGIVCVNRQPFSSPFIQKSYRCDLGDSDRSEASFYGLKYIMKQYNPKHIFHLASKATVKMEGDEPFSMLESNILSTQKVCQWAPKGAKVVLASSVIVYGDRDSSGGYTEEDITDPTSIYGMTKRASESILNYYTSTGQIRGVSARMCATVGRGLTHGVVYDFIRKLKNNPTLEALGSHPGSVKPYCHVDDLTQALMLLSMGEASGVYNIVPDDMINIEEVAETVMASLEIYKDIEWLGEKSNWKGDNKLISVDNAKIKHLGWNPKYKSKQAIVKAVKDIIKS